MHSQFDLLLLLIFTQYSNITVLLDWRVKKYLPLPWYEGKLPIAHPIDKFNRYLANVLKGFWRDTLFGSLKIGVFD